MINKYNFIFVILVYRNSEDLIMCLKSIKEHVSDYKVIIVNSYYDDLSKNSIEQIAVENKCDFLNVSNNGYGAGNNRGIEFAVENYSFDYLIVSNPDIEILKFPRSIQSIEGGDIIAPQIIARDGKNQNPILVIDNPIADYFMNYGFKRNIKAFVLIGFALNKLPRELFLLFCRGKAKKVYGAHGSFVIFSRRAIDVLTSNPYDEKIFLFVEEFVISRLAKIKGLKTIYNPSICIKHNEDGSIELANISEETYMKKSTLYYFENYRKKANFER